MRRALILAAALLLADGRDASSAQDAGAQARAIAAVCNPANVYNDTPPVNGTAIERMHPLVSRARYSQAVENERWDVVLAGLRADAAAALADASVSPEQQNVFREQVDSVLAALPMMPGPADPARAQFLAATVRTVRFRPVHGVESYSLFRGAETIDVGALSVEQARALCWSAMSVDQVLARILRPLEAVAIARLGRLTSSWMNYRTYGYTRQPLELLLFRGGVNDTIPPRGQWMIAHLSEGVDIHGSRADSLLTSTTTVVEFGRLWYRNNFTQYSGLSLIASLGSERTIGYGAMLHAFRSLRAGAVARRADGRTRWSVVTSTDLYGLLEHSKKSVDEGLATARGIVVLPQPR